jgi:micrococcal nuclease
MPRSSERTTIRTSRAMLIDGVKSRWPLFSVAILLLAGIATLILVLVKQSPPVAPFAFAPTATATPYSTLQLAIPPETSPTSALVATASPDAITQARVLRVVDGDTLEVEVSGSVFVVRLSGVDAPDTTPQPICFGREAEEYVRAIIAESGERVWLERDVSDRDSDNKLPRYIWLDPLDAKRMLNEVLLAEGYAKAANFPPDTRYADRFLTVEHDARVSKRGLWGVCGGFGVLLPSQTPFILPTAVIPAPSETSSLVVPTLSEPSATTEPVSPTAPPRRTPTRSPATPTSPVSPTVRPTATSVQLPTQIPPKPSSTSRPTIANVVTSHTPVVGLPYDPNGPDRDCPDFATQAEAQAFFIAAGGPGRDRHRLDGDHDGIACEALP